MSLASESKVENASEPNGKKRKRLTVVKAKDKERTALADIVNRGGGGGVGHKSDMGVSLPDKKRRKTEISKAPFEPTVDYTFRSDNVNNVVEVTSTDIATGAKTTMRLSVGQAEMVIWRFALLKNKVPLVEDELVTESDESAWLDAIFECPDADCGKKLASRLDELIHREDAADDNDWTALRVASEASVRPLQHSGDRIVHLTLTESLAYNESRLQHLLRTEFPTVTARLSLESNTVDDADKKTLMQRTEKKKRYAVQPTAPSSARSTSPIAAKAASPIVIVDRAQVLESFMREQGLANQGARGRALAEFLILGR